MILCISVLSVVISSFSFLILLIWFFSLCFSMSLANGLSILFILSKNQLLALLFFAIVSFVSFAFISAQMLKISFLLLTLGYIISSFSSCFRCRVRLLFDFFLISWGKPVLLCTFPSVLLLQCPPCMDVRVGLWGRLSTKELMLLNYGVGEDSWESLGLQGDPTSPFWRRSALGP